MALELRALALLPSLLPLLVDLDLNREQELGIQKLNLPLQLEDLP